MSDNSIWYEDRAPSAKALQAKIAELEAALQECQDANAALLDDANRVEAERRRRKLGMAVVIAQERMTQLETQRDAARKAAKVWKAKSKEWRGLALDYWCESFRNDTDTRLRIYRFLRYKRELNEYKYER